MGFAAFMASPAGRGIRIVAGIALIVVGLIVLNASTLGVILAVVGAVPLIAGIADFCIFAPLFGGPFQGSKARQAH
jgi:hypothetical protein